MYWRYAEPRKVVMTPDDLTHMMLSNPRRYSVRVNAELQVVEIIDYDAKPPKKYITDGYYQELVERIALEMAEAWKDNHEKALRDHRGGSVMPCPNSLWPSGQHSWVMYNPKTGKRKANWRCPQCGKKRRARN